jgi:hypothetical protein
MKNNFLPVLACLAFVLFTWQSHAQVATFYGFSQSSGTYTEITGGTVLATATASNSLDDEVYTVTGLPFTFTFNGTGYTGFRASTNGFITFGSTAPATNLYSPISSTTTYAGAVSAFGGDLNAMFNLGGRTGEVRWETIGAAPNRTVVVQWKNFRPAYGTSTSNVGFMNFQVHLLEGSNNVRIVYGPSGMAVGTTNISGTRQVGLRGAGSTDFNNRTNSTSVSFGSSTAGTSNFASQAYSVTTTTPGMPANGLTYTWTLQTCFVPSALTASNITPTGASLSWTAPSSAPSGGYEWAVTTSATPPASGTATSTTSATATGLSASTTYYLHVRSSCGAGDFSVWATTSFATPVVVPAPHIEGFATVTTPAGWAISGWDIGSVRGVTGNPGNNIYKNLWGSATTGNFSTVTIGPITSGMKLSFDYKHANWSSPHASPGTGSGNFIVAVSTDFGATYTDLATVANDNNDAWRTLEYDLAAYVGQYLRVRITGSRTSGDYDLAFDNFKVETCPSPASPTVSGLTNTAATVSWSGSGTGYEIVVQAAGTGVPTGAGIAVTGTTYTASGLTGNTAYEVFVRAFCGPNPSQWVGPVNFTTLLVLPAPYTEGFATTAIPTGWTTTGWSISSSSVSGNPGNNLNRNLYSFTPTGTFTTVNIGPVTSAMNLNFDYRHHNFSSSTTSPGTGSGNFVVEISTDFGNTYTTLATVPNDNSAAWRNLEYSMAPYNGQIIRLRITGNRTSGDYYLAFDNFKIEPLCMGTPDPGNTISSAAVVCSGVNLNLSLESPTTGAGVSYQWYVSTTSASGPWTAVGTNAATLTTSQSQGSWYYCAVSCASSAATGNSTPVEVGMDVFTNCYCTSITFTTAREPICLVQFAGINNSTCSAVNCSPALEDFTALPPAMVTPGLSYPITLSGNTDGSFTNHFRVFFDWDQDGVFETSVPIGTINNTNCVAQATGNILIPLSALPGTTRMRVVKNFSTSPTNPCGSYSYGQAEDYSVFVSCAPMTVAPPSAVIVDSECVSNCTVSGGSISAPANPCPIGFVYQYRVNNGAWTSTAPAYAANLSIETRCQCENTPASVSPSSAAVNTAPGSCITPDAPTITIVENVCPSLVGMITADCGPGTVAQYALSPTGPWSATPPAYTEAALTVYARCVGVVSGCEGTVASATTEPVDCSACPVFTVAPPNVGITNSSCISCEVSGGVISAPANACPPGSALQYRVDGGAWSSTLPVYNQTGPVQTIETRCLCDLDGETASPVSASVATAPGVCTVPDQPVIVFINNICPSTAGTITATGCGAGTVVEFSTNANGPWSLVAPDYTTNSFTVYARCRNTTTGCVSSVASAATAPIPCDCLGVANGPAVPGSACDDNNPGTANDTWDNDCNCVGCDLQLISSNVSGADCPGAATGLISISASSQSPVITYAISGPISRTNTNGVFDNIPAGTYTVTASVGLSCSIVETMVVAEGIDITSPVLTCFDQTVSFTGANSLTLNPNLLATASDECGVQSIQLVPNTVTSAQVGQVVPVTVVATDIAGNPAVCISQVTVAGFPTNFGSNNMSPGCSSSVAFYPQNATWVAQATNCISASPFTNDGLSFTGRQLCGNGFIEVEITNMTTNPGTWAGIALRESAAANARKVQLATNGVSSLTRREVRYTTGAQAFPADFLTGPRRWLRLERTGNVFTGYVSSNGLNWFFVMSVSVPMNSCIEAGLVLSGASAGTVSATYANLLIGGIGDTPTISRPVMDDVAAEWVQPADFSVYPNPTSGELNVDLTHYSGRAVSIELFNMQGQLLHVSRLDVADDVIEKIDLSGYSQGLYQVRVKSEGTPDITRRVVLQSTR